MQYSEIGPYGINLQQQFDTNNATNTAFDSLAWENAKQDGCLPPPCQPGLPDWPPPKGDGFIRKG